jgi:AraC-like DNA-binding protein
MLPWRLERRIEETRQMLRPKRDAPRGILGPRPMGPAGGGLWRYWPSSDLAPFVEHYWIVEWDVDTPRTAETLPHPSVHLVLERGRRSEVVGVMTGRFTRVLEGKGRVLGTKFRPGGFRPFLRDPVSSLTDRRLRLPQVFGRRAAGLEERAMRHADHENGIAVVESFLRGLRPVATEAADEATRITYGIEADRAITKVSQVAAAFGIGPRKLQRLFREHVGVGPKWVIQRYRLHEAAERMASGETIDWADFALGLGYADQAHFIRDFKKIVGRSPAEYSRSLLAPPPQSFSDS